MNQILTNHYHLAILLFIFGSIIGSFLNVLIYRLPIIILTENSKLSLALPRSFCPKCKKKLLLKHNIPLVSYLLLHSRCNFCNNKISFKYFLVELITACITLLVGLIPNINWNIKIQIILLSYILIPIFIIDLEHQLIPNELSITGLWLGLITNSLNQLYPTLTQPTSAIFGATFGYCFFWLIKQFFLIIRKIDGLGTGDLKMLAMLGAWFGIEAVLDICFYASIIGCLQFLILKLLNKIKLQDKIAFAPSLIISSIIILLQKFF